MAVWKPQRIMTTRGELSTPEPTRERGGAGSGDPTGGGFGSRLKGHLALIYPEEVESGE